MTKFAVISDVHANMEALGAVLNRIGEERIICLGDCVDYGAQPNEVIATLEDRGVETLLGNHDEAALTGDVSRFNASAAMSSIWTRQTLSKESQEFLTGLPQERTIDMEGSVAYFAHGSPDDRLWEYVDPRTHHLLFGHYLEKMNARLIGLGHTHVPFVWKEPRGTVFNPGSVGQPRDGDRRASYALVRLQDGNLEVNIERVEYDVQSAAAKIRAAGLPRSFSERLGSGT